MLEIFI